MVPSPRILKWGVLIIALFAITLVPFALFGEALERWTVAQMESERGALVLATIGAGLLVGDIFLPVPSSFVGTMLGALLGAAAGTIAAAVGLTLGCVLGYVFGHAAGPATAARLVGDEDYRLVSGWLERHGLVALVACRAVPVLAEASIVAAGMARMPPWRTLLVVMLANLGLSAVYASIGGMATNGWGLVAAFAASMLVPAVALLFAKLFRRSAGLG